jgi:pSer/pThr/pTyr-binding forkhead associated (FHA) protein
MKTNNIYGMNYGMIVNHDPCLVFSKDIVWTENDLIAMEKKMLLNYPISRLLPLQLNEMDLQITLCYKLGTKKALSQICQHQTLNEADCFQILFTIVTTILDSKAHLLSEERYLLQESFIYIGTDYMDANLIYLPIYVLEDKPPIQIDLLKLTNDLLSKQGKSRSHKTNKMIQLLNSPHFQLITFKELLFQAITELDSLPEAADYQHLRSNEPWLPLTTKERFIKWKLPKSHNPILIITCLLIIMLIVSFYLIYPSVGMFNLCLGLSLLVMNISFRLNRSISKLETGELPYDNPFGNPMQLEAPFLPDTDYYQHLVDQTTLLAPANRISDATVLLTSHLKAFLELKQGEETELINISSDSFIIGRSIEATQYTVNWIGLSRTHIEIYRLGNEYEIKDLGSKNGSFLNEESMIPHQSYPLNEGDCIKVVEKQFIYKRL